MLADLAPLMTETVEHWLEPAYTITGKPVDTGSATKHPARVVETPGVVVAAASGADMADAGATIWLVNHPRPIAIGDTFGFAGGAVLKVIRVERRTMAGGVLSKVYLS